MRDIYYARVRKQCTDEIKGNSCLDFGVIPLGSGRTWTLCGAVGRYRKPPMPHPSRPIFLDSQCLKGPICADAYYSLPIAFAECALGRTFTVSFACRAPHRVMNNCMKLHATPTEHDAAREEWFAMRLERQKEREHKNRVAVAQEEFMKEWWGLPEDVRLSRQREMEKKVQSQQTK